MSLYTAHYPVQIEGRIIAAGEPFEATPEVVKRLKKQGAILVPYQDTEDRAAPAPKPPRAAAKAEKE